MENQGKKKIISLMTDITTIWFSFNLILHSFTFVLPFCHSNLYFAQTDLDDVILMLTVEAILGIICISKDEFTTPK